MTHSPRTTYSAPHPLMVLAEKSEGDTPTRCAEMGNGAEMGPLIFMSPLDAEMFRQRHVDVCGDHLRICPLEKFGFTELFQRKGGRMAYYLVYGFTMSVDRQFHVRNSKADLGPMLRQHGFGVPADSVPRYMFQFDANIFRGAEEDILSQGIDDYAGELEEIRSWPDKLLRAKARRALDETTFTMKPSRNTWSIYHASATQWRCRSLEAAGHRLN